MGRSRKIVFGKCHICGVKTKLTFEHIPPKKAFNNRRVMELKIGEDILSLGPDELIKSKKGEIKQKGMGDYTLCEKCNNNTGSWYGADFIDWCYQGMESLVKTKGKPRLIYLRYLFPLSIIKQIITMFFSVNNENFSDNNSYLVKFVLNKKMKYLPPKYRVFVYYNIKGIFRSVGVSGIGKLNVGKNITLSEITFPPYGYVLTMDSDAPNKKLVEITHFANYEYKEVKVMTMKLPVLPTHLYFPGDYRTKEEIKEQAKKSKDYMERKE